MDQEKQLKNHLAIITVTKGVAEFFLQLTEGLLVRRRTHWLLPALATPSLSGTNTNTTICRPVTLVVLLVLVILRSHCTTADCC